MRFGAAAAFIPGAYLVVVRGMGSGGLLTDTWEYAYVSGSAAGPFGLGAPLSTRPLAWRQVATNPTPSGRVFGTLAYDGADDLLALFGGCGAPGCPSLAPWYLNLHPSPSGPPE
ncbi:MAG: hypothetical protein ACREDK_07815 [Thermoplasmata archaeon]